MQSKWRFSTATPILLLLIGVAGPVSAQDEPSRVQAGAGLVVGVPSGEFGNYVTNPGGGITGHLGYRIPNTLAIIGVNVGKKLGLSIPDEYILNRSCIKTCLEQIANRKG